MKRKHTQKSLEHRKIAAERVSTLFSEAKKAFREDPGLSDRYVSLARRIAMKYKIKLPSKLKRRFCKKCFSYLVPGINLRVRTKKGHVIYCCLKCKNIARFGFKP